MSELTMNKIEYMIILVQMFAEKYCISNRLAFNYLQQYNGIQLLEEHYNVLHTLSYDDVIDDTTVYCKKNGGYLQ